MVDPRNDLALPRPHDLLAEGALFLDLDGTLLDLAARPDAVSVPAGVVDNLTKLHTLLGGAIGIITGRRLDDVDVLLAPLRLPVAAEHGGVVRPFPSGGPRSAPLPPLPPGWVQAARIFAEMHAGLVFEPKTAGFVIHHRQAPRHAEASLKMLRGLIGSMPGFEILPAAMAWELRPKGVHKGLGLRALMQVPPFAGRRPYFIGDDVTDEDAIAAARALGGEGYRMAEHFGQPASLRAWLGTLHVT